MLILKVAPIEFIGIIATIITAVIFAIVLGFQVVATRAATKSATSATAQMERLRPHVVIHPPFAADLTATGSVMAFRIENVGFAPAFGVSPTLRAFDAGGIEIEDDEQNALSQDLPPTHEIRLVTGEVATKVWPRVIAQEAGLVFQVTIEYAMTPEGAPSHKSEARYQITYDGNTTGFNILEGKFDRLL